MVKKEKRYKRVKTVVLKKWSLFKQIATSSYYALSNKLYLYLLSNFFLHLSFFQISHRTARGIEPLSARCF